MLQYSQYIVEKIKESVPPSAKIIAVVGSKPLGGTLSEEIKAHPPEKSKPKCSLSDSTDKQLTKGQQGSKRA